MRKLSMEEVLYRRRMNEWATDCSRIKDQNLRLDIDKKRDAMLYETEHAEPTDTTDDVMFSVQEWWLSKHEDLPPQPHLSGEIIDIHIDWDHKAGDIIYPKKAPFNTYITIEAIPKPLYEFVGWSDGVTDNPRTILVDSEEISITAIFKYLPTAFYISPASNVNVTPNNLVNPEYSFDNEAWSTYLGGAVPVNAGDKIYWRADGRESYSEACFIVDGGDFVIGGDAMSLLQKTDYRLVTSVPKYGFKSAFANMTNLVDASDLGLYVESIGMNGCESMFEGSNVSEIASTGFLDNVTSLGKEACAKMFSKTPIKNGYSMLNGVSIISDGSMKSMFEECTALVGALDMPSVTSIGTQGMERAYKGCTALASSHDMPLLTSIGSSGMREAFTGDVSLSNAIGMPLLSSADNNALYAAYEGCTGLSSSVDLCMLKNMGSYALKEMFKDSGVSTIVGNIGGVSYGCCMSMFEGCEGITSIPDGYLHLDTKEHCYERMFANCTNLQNIAALADSAADYSCKEMYKGCTSLVDVNVSTTTLGAYSFEGMFEDCESIKNVILGFTRVSDGSCQRMLRNLTSLESITTNFYYPKGFSDNTFTNWVEGVKNFGMPLGGEFNDVSKSDWPQASADGNPWFTPDDEHSPFWLMAKDRDLEFIPFIKSHPGQFPYTEYQIFYWSTDLQNWENTAYWPGHKITLPKGKRVYIKKYEKSHSDYGWGTGLLTRYGFLGWIEGYEENTVNYFTHYDKPDFELEAGGNLMSLIVPNNEDILTFDFTTLTDAFEYAFQETLRGCPVTNIDKVTCTAKTIHEGTFCGTFASTWTDGIGKFVRGDYEIVYKGEPYEYGPFAFTFNCCDGLVDVSNLELSCSSCQYLYEGMFQECYNLKSTPTMTFDSVTNGMCMYMFRDCYKLEKIIIPNYVYNYDGTFEHDPFEEWAFDVSSWGDFVCSKDPESKWPFGPSGNPWVKNVKRNEYLWFEMVGGGEYDDRGYLYISTWNPKMPDFCKKFKYSYDLEHWLELPDWFNRPYWRREDRDITRIPLKLGQRVYIAGNVLDVEYTEFYDRHVQFRGSDEWYFYPQNLKMLFNVGGYLNAAYNSFDYKETEYKAELACLFHFRHGTVDASQLDLFYNIDWRDTKGTFSSMFAENYFSEEYGGVLKKIPNINGGYLTEGMFHGMFYASAIEELDPELFHNLPKEVPYSTFQSMFEGCRLLKNAPSFEDKVHHYSPEIPGSSPYGAMFAYTAIEEVPKIPSDVPYLSPGLFASTFKSCHNIKKVPSDYLPCNNMLYGEQCYASMFEDCINLEEADLDLPTYMVAGGAYARMFAGCVKLKRAVKYIGTPDLTSTSQYESMYEGCTSLETTPDLSSEFVTWRCYARMFDGCASLTDDVMPSVLPATTLNIACYYRMFAGCTGITKAPEILAHDDGIPNDYNKFEPGEMEEMFEGCTSLVEGVPLLKFQAIHMRMYKGMYKNCTSLTDAGLVLTYSMNFNNREPYGGMYEEMYYNCSSLHIVYNNYRGDYPWSIDSQAYQYAKDMFFGVPTDFGESHSSSLDRDKYKWYPYTAPESWTGYWDLEYQ